MGLVTVVDMVLVPPIPVVTVVVRGDRRVVEVVAVVVVIFVLVVVAAVVSVVLVYRVCIFLLLMSKPFISVTQVPAGAPLVTNTGHFLFAKMEPRLSNRNEEYVGTVPVVPPSRRLLQQQTRGEPYYAYTDPNLESEYRPTVQDCYIAYNANQSLARPLTNANITNGGFVIRDLTTTAPPEAGLFELRA